MMEVRWRVDDKISGFEYSFFDYIIKEYSDQDNVKDADIIQLAVYTVK